MAVTKDSEQTGTALDLLESEDLELRRLFSALRLTRGTSVDSVRITGTSQKKPFATWRPARRRWRT